MDELSDRDGFQAAARRLLRVAILVWLVVWAAVALCGVAGAVVFLRWAFG